MLKPIHTFATLLFIPLAVSAQAPSLPSVDQIVTRYVEACGGMDKIKAIQSLRSSGHVFIGPMTLDLSIENPRGAFRSDTSINGLTKTEAFDGTHGWIIDPLTKGPGAAVEPMNADQLKQVALQEDFEGPLVDYKQKGNKVTLRGLEKVNGVDAYALKIDLKNGDELTSFIDAKSYLEVFDINNAVADGKTVVVETTLGDYRRVNGMLLPFSLEIRSKGQTGTMKIQLDRMEANTPIDQTRFRMPETAAHLPAPQG